MDCHDEVQEERSRAPRGPTARPGLGGVIGLAIALLGLGCSDPVVGAGQGGGGQGGAGQGGEGGGGPKPPVKQPAPVVFDWINRTQESGLKYVESTCETASFGDLDGDGAADLVVPNEGLDVYRNDGQGHFSPWAKVPLPADEAQALKHVCPQAIEDLDGDGRLDVVLPLNGGTRVALFFNEGGGAFTLKLFGELRASEHDVSPFAVGVLAGKDSEPVLAIGRNLETAEKSLDFQKCGFDPLGINVECSIVVPSQASTFYTIHRAQRSLEPIAPSALTGEGNALGYGILDIDGDERQDLIAAMDFLPQRAFRRSGPSSFEEPAQDLGLNVFAHGMGVALGDWDDDGHTDAVITTLGGVLDFAGTPSGGFAFRGSASPFMTRKRSIWPWTALFADLDNDGHLDLYLVNQFSSHKESDPLRWFGTIGGPEDFFGAYNTVFLQRPGGIVAEGRIPYDAIRYKHAKGRAAAIADVDGDGRLDVAMVLRRRTDGLGHLSIGSLNVGSGHGLSLRFRGGAAVPGLSAEITCDGRKQRRELYGAEGHAAAARKELHFGCGAATSYDALTLRVPGKAPLTLPGGMLDRALLVELP